MKIGIDYHTAFGLPQGSQTYIINLVSQLTTIDRHNDYTIYAPKKEKGNPLSFSNANINYALSASPLLRLGWDFPRNIIDDGLDVAHFIYITPIWKRCKYVLTVHDILFEQYPEYFDKLFVLRSKLFVRQSIKHADAIFTISDFSCEAISETYGIDKINITITPLGVSELFRPIKCKREIDRVLEKYRIKKPYILYVGRIEPRKNLTRLIKAFSILLREGWDEHSLVIGGVKDFGYNEIFETVNILKLDSKIIFPGRIYLEDMPALLSGAKVFVYPAVCEGFGLPVLEAMACGVPVVTSGTTSLPRIVGDAGILVDPLDVESIAHGIYSVLSEAAMGQKLSTRGIERAKEYSWRSCAEKTLQVYSSLSS